MTRSAPPTEKYFFKVRSASQSWSMDNLHWAVVKAIQKLTLETRVSPTRKSNNGNPNAVQKAIIIFCRYLIHPKWNRIPTNWLQKQKRVSSSCYITHRVRDAYCRDSSHLIQNPSRLDGESSRHKRRSLG